MDMEESEFSEEWPEFVVQPYQSKSVADFNYHFDERRFAERGRN
jgi:hypothetical protein